MITLTFIIIIFTCIISYNGFNDRAMQSKFLMHPASVNEFGQWYRFITSGFLHGDLMHLGINMFVLYQFGERLEDFCMRQFGDLTGRIYFIILYFGAIIAGSVPSYIKHKNNQYYSALGASGGVSGILFASIFIDPWNWLLFLLFIPMPYIVFGVIYVLYESYMDKKGNTKIAHDAHLAGAAFGYIIIIAFIYMENPHYVDFFLEKLKAGPRPLSSPF